MSFVREDWMLFRSLSTLGQKAGVGQGRLAPLVVKELTDNALDAGGERCSVGRTMVENGFFVEDDGPGIPGTDEELAELFSIRRPLRSTKLLRLPTRGALGNGLRVVTGAVAATGGQISVRTRGRLLLLEPQDDGTSKVKDRTSSDEPGTRVEIVLGAALDGRHGTWMGDLAVQMRGESRYEGKSSPWWYDSDAFFELCSAFDGPLYGLLELLAGKYPASRAREEARLPHPEVKAASLDRRTVEQILSCLRSSCREPKPSVLGSVGEAALYCHGYARRTGSRRIPAAIGDLEAHVPHVVEVWARRLERGENPRVQFYVNRTPVAAPSSAGLGRKRQFWINGCGVEHYFRGGADPFMVHVCVTTPYMQITTDGKEPNLAPLLDDIHPAVELACRKGRSMVASSGRPATKIDSVKSVLDEAMDAASGGRKHRFSLRQLYYAVRPLLQDLGDEEELAYTYFAQIVTKVEASLGKDLPGVYRDARGTLYHPHTGEQIALGTLAVEEYERPAWTFNKILYVEKGGFFPLLIDEKWAERHDCALLTSQGFATRAARDVIDLLGETDEPVKFYCAHDADAFGTNIHAKLVEATLARPERKVEVVNLGLEPWEAKEMGLLSERLTRKDDDELAVAGYVRAYDRQHGTRWREWLQDNRYELNAMSSPKFLAWLDSKMAEQGSEKVVPPFSVLRKTFREKAGAQIRQNLLDELARKNRVDERVSELLDKAMAEVSGLGVVVIDHLDAHPEHPWKTPVEELAVAKANELTAG